MTKIEELSNYDEIVKSVAAAMFNHDAECCRVNEDLWIRVKEDGTGEVLEGNYYFNDDDNEYIFVHTLDGNEDDQVEEYIKFMDNPVVELAYLLDMSEDDLLAKAAEFEGIEDLEDADYHTVVEYIRETPELFEKVKAAYIDWLKDAVDYEEKATLYLDQVDEYIEYENGVR